MGHPRELSDNHRITELCPLVTLLSQSKMSKEAHKESKVSHSHGLHLHLPSRKPGRSQSAGRVSPISFLGRRKSNNGHSTATAGNGNGENSGNGNGGKGGGWRSASGNGGADVRAARGGVKESASVPSSLQVSPTTSPKQLRKGSLASQTMQVTHIHA